MFALTNLLENNNKKILVSKKDDHHVITIDKIWFFKNEDFLDTLEKTFKNYHPKIHQEGDQFTVLIEISHQLGSILKDFYESIYNNWLYY
jgi:hypothetical protein